MRACLLAILAACGGAHAPPPPAAVANRWSVEDEPPRCSQVDAAALARPSATEGAIAGAVVDFTNDAPYEGATIVAVAQRDHEQIVVSDACGNYAIGPLPPGTYTMLLYAEDRTSTREPVTVTAGKVTRARWRTPDPKLAPGEIMHQ